MQFLECSSTFSSETYRPQLMHFTSTQLALREKDLLRSTLLVIVDLTDFREVSLRIELATSDVLDVYSALLELCCPTSRTKPLPNLSTLFIFKIHGVPFKLLSCSRSFICVKSAAVFWAVCFGEVNTILLAETVPVFVTPAQVDSHILCCRVLPLLI